MTHSQAIELLIERFQKRFSINQIRREQHFNTRPTLIPDIAIDLDSGSKWIVVEVGTTQAKKVNIYRQDPRIEKLLWYDKESLKLVGIWNFKGQYQQAIFEDSITQKSKAIESIGMIEERTKRNVKILQQAQRELRQQVRELKKALKDKTLGFVGNDRTRVLCPVCLKPIPFKDAEVWRSGPGAWAMIGCKFCTAGDWPAPPIMNQTDAHPAISLWNAFIAVGRESKKWPHSFFELMRRGFGDQ